MAVEIRQYPCVIPAGTPQNAPVRIDLTFPPRTVERVEIDVPPGSSGLMGFALQNSGVTVIPFGSAAFIVAVDVHLSWDLTDYIDSGSWQLLGYNTDVFAHSVYVRFLLNLVPEQAGPVIAPAPSVLGMTSDAGTTVAGLTAAVEASA